MPSVVSPTACPLARAGKTQYARNRVSVITPVSLPGREDGDPGGGPGRASRMRAAPGPRRAWAGPSQDKSLPSCKVQEVPDSHHALAR
jgi:hypothetical protein